MLRWIRNLNERTVLIVLVLVAVFSIAFSALSHWLDGEGHWWAWADSAFQNFSTEMIGAVVTFALFELVIGVKNEKKNLLLQLRSKHNAIALNALEQIKEWGWHSDATLKHAHLSEANLANANLTSCDLRFAYLFKVNMNKADIRFSNLYNANMRFSDLKEANLRKCNLQETDMAQANLQGADLKDASLVGADLKEAKFDENTSLPDSKWNTSNNSNKAYINYWTSETDMSRYTNPNHPDFWQPDWVKTQEKKEKFS